MEFWGGHRRPDHEGGGGGAEEFVHVTQVALAADAKPGVALTIVVGDGDQHVLYLDKGKCDQVGLDIVVDEKFSLEVAPTRCLTGLRQYRHRRGRGG